MNDTVELARAVHKGDLAAAQKVLLGARYRRDPDNSFNLGIRAAERDMGRDPPLPAFAEPVLIEKGPAWAEREKAREAA